MSPRRSTASVGKGGIPAAAVPRALLAAAVILAVLAAQPVYALEVDVIARLVYVVDGDTVRLIVVKACSERFAGLVGFEGRLRLADINAPELYTPEGLKAKAALETLLAGKQVLYIDVDDLYVFDKYGRIVGVLLVDYNESSLLNVNEWLLEKGYAEPRDYPNEFTPHWSLYVPRDKALRACLGESQGSRGTTPRTTTVTLRNTVTVTRTLTETLTLWSTRTVTVTARETVTLTRFTTVTTTTTTATVATTCTTVGVEGCGAWLLAAAVAAAAAGYLAGAARRR